MPYVYILKSLKDSKKYTGSTLNLDKRIQQHNKGYVKSTRHRKPFVLYAYQVCKTIGEASVLEKKYKRSHDLIERMARIGKLIIVNGV